ASVRNGLGETREVAEIILSEDDDLAILILNESYPEDYSLDIEDLKPVNTGEDVFVIGYPAAGLFGTFHPSITSGIISNPRGFGGKEGEFQMTAKINPGNSGGPIFNKYGEIVGLATGGLSKKVMEEESLNNTFYGVTAIRALNFINRPIQVSMKPRFEYSSAELYKYMRSGVVFVVGQ
ncbi:serine protease, partial [Alphaproteobacteria bacterium]|nr:serine protease [Alphaproteobacteria bacterium]